MGILNVTPDSFSDGGHFFGADQAIQQGLQMAAEGADIIDIGGESTRPFGDSISPAEEMQRVLPVIEALAPKLSIPISIDTTKAIVANAALSKGATIVNDISALRGDAEMVAVLRENNAPVILMHMQGTPQTMQVNPTYEQLIPDIYAFLAQALEQATEGGIERSKCIVDPGIGFGKTLTHNLQLMDQIDRFGALGVPVLVGASRKAFLRTLVKRPDQKDISPEAPEVAIATQASVAAAAIRGAHIVRVHDVAPTCATLKVIDAIRMARQPEPLPSP